jgi:metal-responsive CopG/Arc/MetJ family transcriptional regulator
MARRTVHIPDDLDDEVTNFGSTDDSYSGIVCDALREYLEDRKATSTDDS